MTSPAAPPGPALRDIHLPPDPGWWPPAPGWWGLAAVAAVALGALAWWAIGRLRRRRARQRLLAALDRLVTEQAAAVDPAVAAAGLHQLLRRAALRLDPAAGRARGEQWRAILATVPVPAPTLQALLDLDEPMYRPCAFDAEAATRAVRDWLHAALAPPPRSARHA